MLRHFLQCVLHWNPHISLAICFYFSGVHELLPNWLYSLAIAEIVSLTCFGGVRGFRYLELQYFKLRGRVAPNHGHVWYLGLSGFFMPLGLCLAFWVVFNGSRLAGSPVEWPNIHEFKNSLLIGALIMGAFVALKTRADAREAAREAELRIRGLENERLVAQLAALTAQMNPHLLFNALNTVASLIPSDPRKAEETTLRLSELYRGVLESSRRGTHSLAEELALCRAYLEIESARFGERLRSVIEVSDEVRPERTRVPALSIQPLVENAVRHGLASRAAGGEIRVTASASGGTVTISVEDDGVGFGNSSARPGAGTGLENCEKRLRLGFGEKGRLDILPRTGGGSVVRVQVPAFAEESA